MLIKFKEKIGSRFGIETPPPETGNGPSYEDATSESYLSIRTAKKLLQEKVSGYDPERYSEWLGFARYIYSVKKDYKNAKFAIDAALLFYDSSEIALNLKSDIEKNINRESQEAMLAAKKLREAEEKAKAAREAEEKKSRSAQVSEVVISENKSTREKAKEISVTGDFTDEDFLADTSENVVESEVDIATGLKRPAMQVEEITLVNDRNTPLERKKLIAEAKSYVIRHSKLAEDKYSAGKLHESLLEYEKIYLKILEVDEDDVKSLYNLVLLYKKMGEQKNAQETFIKLIDAINITSAKYSGVPNIKKIYYFADCALKAAIVNAAVLAYNRKSSYPMNRSNFDLGKLREKGYLVIGEDDEREVSLSMVKDSFTNRNIKTFNFIISGHSCKLGGKYSIGENGSVTCNVHGDSALILNEQELDGVSSSSK